LVRNPDILASVAALKPAPFTVGFAAETENVAQHAREKLERKKVDLVAANQVGSGIGFESDENRLLLVEKDSILELPLQSKHKLARLLIQHIAERYRSRSSARISQIRT